MAKTLTSEGYEVPFKINEWIEEEKIIEVNTPKGKEAQVITERVMYVDAPPKQYMCSWENHRFEPTDHKLGNLLCKHCGMITQLSPVNWKIIDGQAIRR